MNHVIRRSVLILSVLTAVLLSACAGGSVDALSVGERSISHDGLAEMITGLDGGVVDEPAIRLSADRLRAVGNVWLLDAAVAEHLRSEGTEIDAAARTEAETFIAEAVAAGQIGDLDPSSEGYEALINNVWVAGLMPEVQADADATAAISELLNSAEVASNIGVWSPESTQILPSVVAG